MRVRSRRSVDIATLAKKGIDERAVRAIVSEEHSASELKAITALCASACSPAAARLWETLTGEKVTGVGIEKEPRGKRATEGASARTLHLRSIAAGRQRALSLDEALDLPLATPALVAMLRQPGSKTSARILAEISQVERDQGDNNGVVGLLDAKRLRGEARNVFTEIRELSGKSSLTLQEIEAFIPDAVASLLLDRRARKSAATLFVDVANETVHTLAHDYGEQVVRGHESDIAFFARRGIRRDDGVALVKALTALFPKPTGVELDALYAKASEPSMTLQQFCRIAQLTSDDVRRLQRQHPGRFPRQDGIKSYAVFPACRKDVAADVADLDGMVADWKKVLAGESTVRQFLAVVGLSQSAWDRMQAAHAKVFPPLSSAGIVGGGRITTIEMVRAFAKKFEECLDKHVFCEMPDVVAFANQDRDFVKRYGEMTLHRGLAFRQDWKDRVAFPSQQNYWRERLKTEVETLVKSGVTSRADIGRALEKCYPKYTRKRLRTLEAEDPGLIPPQTTRRLPSADRRQLTKDVAALRRRQPPLTYSEIIAALQKKYPAIDKTYVATHFARHLRSGKVEGLTADNGDREFRALPAVHDMFTLLARLAPPGTPQVDIVKALNTLLEERGVLPFSILQEGGRERGACRWSANHEATRRIAEVVAEYVSQARKGEPWDSIALRICRDHPRLHPHLLSRQLKVAVASPDDAPAIKGLMRSGKLALDGRGEKVSCQRFIGGWSVDRAVLGAPAAEIHEIARLAQTTKIALRLPLLDSLLDDLAGRHPLRGQCCLWVSHLLADAVPMERALRRAGISGKSHLKVVGTPYGSNPVVVDVLKRDGVDVRVPSLTVADFERSVEKALDRLARIVRTERRSLVIIDDGGVATRLLHQRPKYADILQRVRVVEQTTGGINYAEKCAREGKLRVPIVTVARSKAKRAEKVGRVVVEKLRQALARSGTDVKGKRVVITGYGFLAPDIAASLARRGAHVTVMETSTERAAEAGQQHQFVNLDGQDEAKRMAQMAPILRKADVVIGVTGALSLPLAALRHLKDGAVIASASSKRVELDMEGLERSGKRTAIVPDNPLVTAPSARYLLEGKEITVVGDGWPVNFDGDVQSMPPEDAQLTIGALFGGALQAAGLVGEKFTGLVSLDEELDDRLCARQAAYQKGRAEPPISSPNDWEAIVRSLAERLSDPLSTKPV
jgi:S-adenosylhomocysteine hydrolase